MARFFARRLARPMGLAWALVLVGAASSVRAGDAPRAASRDTASKAAKPSSKNPKAARVAEAGARRAIAGGPVGDDPSNGPESEELRSLREAERELFAPAAPASGHGWPSDLPALLPGDGAPHIVATGLPAAVLPEPSRGEFAVLPWLDRLEMPDLPVRWDDRVIRYLRYFRDDPRGRATFANLLRRSGRWREMMRRVLRRKSLPEDLIWVSMMESGFDVSARSTAGAMGLWQFMPETAKIYGLVLDRWLDQRLDGAAATEAAANFLGDLHRRFGSWELALAGFNMGYVGLSSVVRRYNTNDFWSLARTEGTLPWETTLYVPKVVAAAVIAHNLIAFGFGDLVPEPPMATDEVSVSPGTPLALVAQAAGCSAKEIEALNPELRAARTPPSVDGAAYPVKVPQGKGSATAQALTRFRKEQPPLERYVVRFGETLEQIAASCKTTPQRLAEVNAILPGEVVRGGTVLLVPRFESRAPVPASGRPVSGGSVSGASVSGASVSGASASGASASGASASGASASGASASGASASASGASASASGASGASASGASVSGASVSSASVSGASVSGASASKPTVVVPADVFVYPGRKRVFYRVLAGDSLSEIATVLHVSPDELRRWNGLDASARLQGGMTLQAFVIPEIDLSKIVTSSEDEVRVLAVGSDEFFSMLEHDRGFRRILVTARSGDTIESIGRRYEVSPRTMERVNRRARNEALKSGEPVIVYLPAQPDGGRGAAKWAPIGLEPAREAMMGEAVPNGPLPLPPAPDLLP